MNNWHKNRSNQSKARPGKKKKAIYSELKHKAE